MGSTAGSDFWPDPAARHAMNEPRRFPAPWRADKTAGGYVVCASAMLAPVAEGGAYVMDDDQSGIIVMERGSSGAHYALLMTAPGGRKVSVQIHRTETNGDVMEYFFRYLKDGLRVRPPPTPPKSA